MSVEIEVKKVDAQGRLILPSDWREDQLKGSNEVYVIKRKGYLKMVPKRKIGLGKFFDLADLDVDAIGERKDFERTRAEKHGT